MKKIKQNKKDYHNQVIQLISQSHNKKSQDIKEIKKILKSQPQILNDFGQDEDFPTTMLSYACFLGQEAAALYFISLGADVNLAPRNHRPPIFMSVLAQSKNMNIIHALLKAGADVNARDEYNEEYSNNAQTMLQLAAYYRDLEAMGILLELGIDIDEIEERNPLGKTALEVAINNNKTESIDFLIAYKEKKKLSLEVGKKTKNYAGKIDNKI